MDRGSGVKYNLHVNSKDTNGMIVRYYWDERSTFDSTTLEPERKTSDSLFSRTIGANEVNTGWPTWIHVRDDDGLVRGGRFVVFADSAPRAITATSDAVTGGRKFSWSGLDAKDSLATEYRILVKKGSQLTATDTTAQFIAKDWTPGSASEFGFANNIFKWTYTPPDPPDGTWYYYQIIARDKRGTISALPLSGANVFSY